MSRLKGKIILYSDADKQALQRAAPGALISAPPARRVEVNHHPEYYRAILDAIEISAAKNHDYASGDDPLGNFRGVEEFGVPAPTGLLCRMVDKISRIRTYFTKGELKVQGEGLEDALMDLGNYCFLMIALLRDEAEKKDHPAEKYVTCDPMYEE